MADAKTPKTSSIDSSYPVLVPADEALFLSDAAFKEYLDKLLPPRPQEEEKTSAPDVTMTDAEPTGTADDAKSSAPTDSTLTETAKDPASTKTGQPFVDGLRSYDATASSRIPGDEELRAQNKMLTTKLGVTNASTNDARLDLFVDLEKTISEKKLEQLLEASWRQDPLDTLKIIWNARSIHLGKGERDNFYHCIAWLRRQGQLKTIIMNLPWAVRPIIEKKVPSKDDKDDKEEKDDVAVMVDKLDVDKDDAPVDIRDEASKEGDITEYDLPTGVAHGYWKDLLNLLLQEVISDPQTVLKSRREQTASEEADESEANESEADEGESNKRRRSSRTSKGTRHQRSSGEEKTRAKRAKRDSATRDARLQAAAEADRKRQETARKKRHEEATERHRRFIERFEQNQPDGFYRALHLTVARLFADQLQRDLRLLESGKKGNLKRISLAAKWAPSLQRLHDKYTFIASTIAELLYPASAIGQDGDSREMYLKRARERYRGQCLSPLRKALAVVERDVSAETFAKIDYQTVPSLAMRRYKDLFLEKDAEHFMQYVDAVAAGEKRISGAVLQPAVLVAEALKGSRYHAASGDRGEKRKLKDIIAARKAEMDAKVSDGQWNSLVQRIRDSGKLENSIAVCDVSGSMCSPRFDDGTTPLHSAIGLSLLLAEITEPPFGGNVITFSEEPEAVSVGGRSDTRTFTEKVRAMESMRWGGTTNFVAVFEKLILPMAIKNKIKPEEMVKQVFVFSDMHFDSAQPSSYEYVPSDTSPSGRTTKRVKREPSLETHHERLQRQFEEAGYEMPRMIYWNLAGGSTYGAPVYGSSMTEKEGTAPKAVTKDVPGTAMVSGYSQGQMKVFLSGGLFDKDEDDEEKKKKEDEDEEMVMVETEMKDGKEEIVEKVEKKEDEMTPLKTMMKAIGHSAYSMLRVVD